MEWTKTPEGLKEIADNVGFEYIEGRDDCEYIVSDPFGRSVNVPPSEVTFLQAAVISGEATPSCLIEVREKPIKVCDLCGNSSHCCKSAKDQETHEFILACNHCLIHNEKTHLRDEGNQSGCIDCVVTECVYHPLKEII